MKGNEGGLAARASDNSIVKFCFFKRFLFVYRRECYRKNTYLLNMFYGKILFIVFIFNFSFLLLFFRLFIL
jgi:hypothetical protein